MRLLLAVWVAAFVGVAGTAVALSPEGRVFGQLAYGVPLMGWAVLQRRGGADRLSGWLVVAVVGYVGVVVAARDFLGAAETVAAMAAYVLLFILMRDVAATRSARGMVAFGAVCAACIWLLVIDAFWIREKIAWIALGGGLPYLVESPRTPFWLSGNLVPFLVLAVAPLLAWLPTNARRLLIPVFIPAAVVAVGMSGGRAGAVGVAIAVIVLIALRRSDVRDAGRRGGIVLGSSAVLVTVGIVFYADRLLEASGLAARVPLWEQAIMAFLGAPLAGHGPSSYSWVRMEVADAPAVINASHAHNVVLQTAAEGGAVLVVILGVMVTLIVREVIRHRASLTFAQHASIAGLVGTAVACQLDDPTRLPAITALIVINAAWLVGPPRLSVGRWWHPMARLVPVAALLIAVPAVIAVNGARWSADLARMAAREGDLGIAVSHAEDAVAWYPTQPGYRLMLAQLQSLDGNLVAGREDYEAAARLQPADARAWGGLAATTPNPADRLEYLRRASALGADPRYAWALGRELEARGDLEGAARAFARAVALRPTLLGLVPADSGASRVSADDVIESLATELAGMARSSYSRGDIDAAVAIIRDEARPEPVWEAVRLARQGAINQALTLSRTATDAHRYDPKGWLLRAHLAELACEPLDGDRFRSLADIAGFGADAPVDDPVAFRSDLPYEEVALDSYQPELPSYPPEAETFPGALLPHRNDAGC